MCHGPLSPLNVLHRQPRTRQGIFHSHLYDGQGTEEFRDQNFICFGEDGSVVLLEGDYKTKYAYGPSRTDLTALPSLTYYIELYRQKFRPSFSWEMRTTFSLRPRTELPFRRPLILSTSLPSSRNTFQSG